MAEPMDCQLRDEVWLRTIHRLGKMQLRDLLVLYQEIHLWAKYKKQILNWR